MKKTVTLISLLLAFALVLAACGTNSDTNAGDDFGANSTNQSNNSSSDLPDAGSNSSDSTNPGNSGRDNSPAPAQSNFDSTRNISILAREDGSGTKTAFMEIIGLKGKADPANVIIQTSTAGILTEVRGNPYAIAYESLGYVTSEVKVLTIDGVQATVDNIKNGTYKISRPLSVVYQQATLGNDVNMAFYTFLQSSNAQQIISDEGYVSLADNAPAYTINGSLSGSIDISGSTSLQPLMTELAEAFENLQPNISVTVSGGGSGTGYNNAEEGVSEFGMISEEFNIEKAPSCTDYVVCKDGIAVIVHVDNPLGNITMDQLRNIYDVDAEADAITVWNEIIQ